MIGLASGVQERCFNIVSFKVRKIFKDSLVRNTFSEHSENVGDADAHAADAGSSTAFARFYGDAFEKFHEEKVHGTRLRSKAGRRRKAEKGKDCDFDGRMEICHLFGVDHDIAVNEC